MEEDWTKRLQLRSAKSTLTRCRRRHRALPARDILQLDGNWQRFDAVESGSESEADSEMPAAPVLASSSAATAAAAVKVAALSLPPSPVFMELELEDESRSQCSSAAAVEDRELVELHGHSAAEIRTADAT